MRLLLLLIAALFTVHLPIVQANCPEVYSPVIRISNAPNGTPGNAGSYRPAISGGGEWVVFESNASNLMPQDSDYLPGLFLYHRGNCQISGVLSQDEGIFTDGTISTSGDTAAFTERAMANAPSKDRTLYTGSADQPLPHMTESAGDDKPALSADGRFAAYVSFALAPSVNNTPTWSRSIYVVNRESGQTELISVGINGQAANGASDNPSISADGRYVAFQSDASNLVPEDNNNRTDVFIYDRQLGQMERILYSDGWSTSPSISANGRYVAFAFDLASSYDYPSQVMLYDRRTRTIELISADQLFTGGNGDSGAPSISASGRFVAFESWANNFVAQDFNWCASPVSDRCPDIFVRDRQQRGTYRVSTAADGTQANGESRAPVISADGRYVAFQSDADNLVPGDTGNTDVFVVDWQRLPQTSDVWIVVNGDFSDQTSRWYTWGAITQRVSSGIFEFYRSQGGTSAAVVQETGITLLQPAEVEVVFQLGNTSSTRQRVGVIVHDEDWDDLHVCSFWLPPNLGLQNYRVQAPITRAWGNLTLSFYASPATSEGWIQLDNVSATVNEGVTPLDRTLCIDPQAP